MNHSFSVLRTLILQHRARLLVTYLLFTVEMLAGLLRLYYFGEAINGMIQGTYTGLVFLIAVHLLYLITGTIRHMYDTRTYTAIYTSLVTRHISRRFNKQSISRLSAHSTLARELVDFLEHDIVYLLEAGYGILGSLLMLFVYDHTVVLICLTILIPVSAASFFYGRKMKRLNHFANDELEHQVDTISSGDPVAIRRHYTRLRNWQIRISDQEALNFGFMELMVLLVLAGALIFAPSLHHGSLQAGTLFAVYSYLLKFTSGLDTIPYLIQRVSALGDITRRMNSGEHPTEQPSETPVSSSGSIVSAETVHLN